MKKLIKVILVFLFISFFLLIGVNLLNNQTDNQLEEIKPEDISNKLAENEKYIIYEDNNKVIVIDNDNQKKTEIFTTDECKFQKIVDDTIYYTINPVYGDTTLTLKSMNTSGTQNKVVKIISLKNIEITDNHSVPEIIQFDIDKDNFFITYGYYKDKSLEINDSDIIIFNTNTQKELVLKDYNHYELFEKDNKKYLKASSNKEENSDKIIDIQDCKEIK